jgi:hypothetical protein
MNLRGECRKSGNRWDVLRSFSGFGWASSAVLPGNASRMRSKASRSSGDISATLSAAVVRVLGLGWEAGPLSFGGSFPSRLPASLRREKRQTDHVGLERGFGATITLGLG